MFGKGTASIPATATAARRMTSWRSRLRACEPWLLALMGFSLTAAGMLANQDERAAGRTASLVEQIKFTGENT